MRPQHITAENGRPGAPIPRVVMRASMRPQHITAENLFEALRRSGAPARFNEAAAYHCGKPRAHTQSQARRRRFNEAAAYHCGKQAAQVAEAGAARSFNEAAAYHCGKHVAAGRITPAGVRFNEAAAYHCGKLRNSQIERQADEVASMRPQHITAENRRVRRILRRREAASMRPQHITAENSARWPGGRRSSASLQ